MAKIKFGMMMTDASGKLGGHVFAKNRGGSYVRTKGIPTNPQTSFQSSVRSMFAAISSAWSGLAVSARLSWNEAVSSYATTDIFGDLRNPSGKALFQRLNQNLALSGQAQLTVCPQPLAVPNGLLSLAGADVSSTTLDIETKGDSTGSVMVISATPKVSAGTSFVKNDYRDIGFFSGAPDLAAEVWGDYVSRFGVIAVGDHIYVGIRFVNANGQASPMQTTKLVVQA